MVPFDTNNGVFPSTTLLSYLKVTLTEKSFQGKGSCESPKRDKWRYASVPVNKQPMTAS